MNKNCYNFSPSNKIITKEAPYFKFQSTIFHDHNNLNHALNSYSASFTIKIKAIETEHINFFFGIRHNLKQSNNKTNKLKKEKI